MWAYLPKRIWMAVQLPSTDSGTSYIEDKHFTDCNAMGVGPMPITLTLIMLPCQWTCIPHAGALVSHLTLLSLGWIPPLEWGLFFYRPCLELGEVRLLSVADIGACLQTASGGACSLISSVKVYHPGAWKWPGDWNHGSSQGNASCCFLLHLCRSPLCWTLLSLCQLSPSVAVVSYGCGRQHCSSPRLWGQSHRDCCTWKDLAIWVQTGVSQSCIFLCFSCFCNFFSLPQLWLLPQLPLELSAE